MGPQVITLSLVRVGTSIGSVEVTLDISQCEAQVTGRRGIWGFTRMLWRSFLGRTPCNSKDLGSDLYLPLITRKIGTFVSSHLNSHNLDGAAH